MLSSKEMKKSSFKSTPLRDKESQEGSFCGAGKTQAYSGSDQRMQHENAVIPQVEPTEVETIFNLNSYIKNCSSNWRIQGILSQLALY